jgi:hypothetical protein
MREETERRTIRVGGVMEQSTDELDSSRQCESQFAAAIRRIFDEQGVDPEAPVGRFNSAW